MLRARVGHTAVTLGDGTVLVAGGAPDCLGCAEWYDAAADAWTETGAMAVGRTRHTATLLSDGRVLVIGGLDAAGAPLASAEIFDPEAGAWSPAAEMGWPRAQHTATLLMDGRVLVVGGETFADAADEGELRDGAEVYDPMVDEWTPLAPVQPGRWDHTATLMPDGQVLVAGGRVRRGAGTRLLREAEVFDPTRDVWFPTGRMRRARAGHVAAMLDWRVAVAGGTANDLAGTSPFDRVEYYSPDVADPRAGGEFDRGPAMFTGRTFAVAVPWVANRGGGFTQTGGGVAVIGGVSDGGPVADGEALLVPNPPGCL